MSQPWVAVAVALLLLPGCFGKGKDKRDSPEVCDEGFTLVEGAGCVADIPVPDANDTIESVPIPHFPSDGASEKILLEIPSFDAHQIPMTIYRPLVANETQQVPIILHSHGFTGKRASADDYFESFIAAGFGVVSFDERGHGDSMDDSEVYFMHPDYEVQDVIKVIDHVATLDWVLMESNATASGPNDPVLGAIGGSYGGAYQLMTAIFDPRLDALVPEITWNDIVDALAPSGAIKSGWVDAFYVAGNAQQTVKFSNDFHEGWAWAAASNEFPAGQGGVVPDLATRLHESSPAMYPEQLQIPTLLIQGMADTLFPLNQAVANLRILEANGVPAALYTHLAGHMLATGGNLPASPVPVGLQGQPGPKPCGELVDLQIAWHQHYLLGMTNVTTGPRVCLSLEDETNVAGDTFPLNGTVMQEFDLGGPTPVVQAPAGPGIQLSLLTATEDTIIAGIPHLTGSITAPGADTIVYFSLQIPGRNDPIEQIVDDQVMPLRIKGPNTGAVPIDMDLGGVVGSPGTELEFAL